MSMMKTNDWNGQKLKIMEEILDEKYGRVLWAYLDYVKVYIINGSVVTDRAVIDYLDDHYGRPVKDRGICY